MQTQQTVDSKSKLNKEVFKTRVLTATFIAIFYLVIFIFAGLMGWQNKGFTWTPWMPEKFIAFLLSLGFIGTVGWLIPKITFEICNSFLGTYKKRIYYLFLWIFIIQVIVPTAFYVFRWYGLLNYGSDPIGSILLAKIFIILFFCFAILSFFIILITAMILKLNKFKIMLLPSLLVFMACSITWIYYLGIIRTWSTLFFVVLLVAICDSSAYIGGSLFGKHKLAPNISPKKTWEGTIVSIIVTLAVMLFFCWILSLGNNQYGCQYNLIGIQFNLSYDVKDFNKDWRWWLLAILFILIMIVSSIFGDLSFSWIKRRLAIKDFSNFLPGHGGILDRLDSISWTITIYATLSLICCGIFNFANFFPLRT